MFGNYGTQQVELLRRAGADVGYVIPDEGALAWLDCWSMTRAATDRPLALAWINYMLEPQVNALLTQRQGLANTLTAPVENSGSAHIVWIGPVEDIQRREDLWSTHRVRRPVGALLMIRPGLTFKLSVLLACIGVLASGATGYYAYPANRTMLVNEAEQSLLTSTELLGQRFSVVDRRRRRRCAGARDHAVVGGRRRRPTTASVRTPAANGSRRCIRASWSITPNTCRSG